MGWAEKEFETTDPGDARRRRRAVLLVERLERKPGSTLPGACGNWAETTAAYRFLGNDKVSWNEVLGAHARASRALLEGSGYGTK